MSDWSLGTTYWPRRKGTLLWVAFDRGEVRDELQHIAAVGFDTVRLPLHWEDFQPHPDRVASHALRALEQTLQLASDARLHVVPALWPIAVAGALHVPAWATAASYAADLTLSTKFGPLLIVQSEVRPPLVWERTTHNTEVRDLWTNPAMLDAQRKLFSEVVGYFNDHPVIGGWELGSGVELARTPSSSDAAGEWLGQTASLAREYGARGTLWYGATLRTLVRREGPRPEAISAAGCTPILSLVPPEPAFSGQPLTPELLRFVAALVQSLGGAPPLLVVGVPAIADAGNRTFADQAYGRAVEQPLFDHDRYAQLLATATELRSAGVRGVWLAHTFCYEQPFVPTEAHSRREQMMGVFDTDGQELPAADAIRQAASPPVAGTVAPLPALDVEDYWNDPGANFRRLWQQWQTPTE